MLKFLVLLFAVLGVHELYGQQDRLTITSSRNQDQSVSLSYEKIDNGTYTVVLQFTQLHNSRASRDVFTVRGYNGELVTLKPIRENEGITYSYAYRYLRGKLPTKVNESVIYTLPYLPGTSIHVSESGFLRSAFFGAETPADWKAYNFFTTEEQMVTASRKGQVVEVIDEYQSENLADYTYTSSRNSVLIEHSDGTLMRYSGFGKGSIKVKAGEVVLPGRELGVNARVDDRYMISCMIYFLKTADFESVSGNLKTAGSLYGFVTPKFAVNDGTSVVLTNNENYKTYVDDNLLTQEMSKRELKKYRKK